jgi:hypothetical protein
MKEQNRNTGFLKAPVKNLAFFNEMKWF